MKMKKMSWALALAGFLGSQAALAEVTYNFSGFGTLEAVHSDSREADFRGNIVQPNGAGRSGATMFGVDTKLGLQATANIGNGFSATVQAVADHRADNSYTPQFEWANLKYQINDTVYVRAGRVVAPVFMVSDFRNVGFSQATVRPAYEIYMLNPITHLDGVEVGTKFDVAGGNLRVQATAGRVKLTVKSRGQDDPINVTGSDRNINMTYEKDSQTFRLGYNRTKTDSQGPGITQIDAAFAAAAAFPAFGYPTPNANLHDIKATLWDLGYIYDDGKWLGQVEYVQARSEGPAVQDTDAWSAMLGYRIGKWTPYAGYSRMTSKEPPLKYGEPVNPFAGTPFGPRAQQLVDGINQFDNVINTHNQQHTVTLGTRYDFYKNVALKLQWDRSFKPGMGASVSPGGRWSGLNRGVFINPTDAFMRGSYAVNLYTVTLDFVF